MLLKMAARILGLSAPNLGEGDENQQVYMDGRGNLQVAQGLPELSSLVRLGGSFQVKTATAFAALTTEPTTTAALSLYNGDQSEVALIDSVAIWERVVDTTQQNQLALFCMNNVAPVTKPTDANLTFRGLSGNKFATKLICAVGATVVDDGWFPHGPSAPGAAAVAGGAWRVTDIPLRGLYLVQPGGMFNMHVAKIAATASQCHAVIRGHQVRLAYAS